MLFVEYPKCSTCKRASKWLKDHEIEVIDRDIKLDPPTSEELSTWIPKSGLPMKRFFNTSGLVYRERGLKDKLATMSDEEKIAELASDGMLVKRPIIVGDDFILVGFKEAEWEEKLLK